jgi:AraC-like DNA-binding protein
MPTVFDSATIAVPERLGALREITAASLMPTAIDSPEPTAFAARLDTVLLGRVQVWSMTYSSVSSRRTTRDIRRSDPEYYQVALVRAGRQGIHQNGASATASCGDLVLYDSSRPYEAVSTNTTASTETAILHFPKKLLPLPAHHVAGLCATPLPGTTGIGRLLAGFLDSLIAGRADYTERDAMRLETISVDLTTAVLAHHLEQDDPPLRSPTHTLYLRMVAFIEDNLHDPELRPATIAAAHQISPRYLHLIFQRHHPVSVAAHIRTRRLDRAARDLADRRLDHLTIAAVARRWGFPRPAEFSRAFQRHAGMPPRDYRSNI